MTNYVSHARTPEELKSEIVGDLHRRIAALDTYARVVAKGAAERSKIERAITELRDMLLYWESVRLARPKTKREQERERKQLDISGRGALPHISFPGSSEH